MPAGPAERGPRDARRRDKWLPWHFKPADEYDREERAAIQEFDGVLSREDAERAAGFPPGELT